MMSLEQMLPHAGAAVDLVLIILLGAILHRLSRNPAEAWREREKRLRAIYDSLRLLVSQAEGQARSLDADLRAHADRLRDLLDRATVLRTPATPTPPRRARVEDPSEGLPLRAQVASLAESGIEAEEIARRLHVPLADVRVLVALEQTARTRSQVAHAGGQE